MKITLKFESRIHVHMRMKYTYGNVFFRRLGSEVRAGRRMAGFQQARRIWGGTKNNHPIGCARTRGYKAKRSNYDNLMASVEIPTSPTSPKFLKTLQRPEPTRKKPARKLSTSPSCKSLQPIPFDPIKHAIIVQSKSKIFSPKWKTNSFSKKFMVFNTLVKVLDIDEKINCECCQTVNSNTKLELLSAMLDNEL